MATRDSRVQRNVQVRTGKFAGDGTREKAPRAAAGTAAVTAGDAYGRPTGRRDDSPLREPFLAFPCARYRSRGRGPGARGVARGRETAACVHGRGGGRKSRVRARDRSRGRRADTAKATCRSHGVRNDHTGSRDRAPRPPRSPRRAAGRDLAGIRRADRAGDHARTAPLVHPCLRARARRPGPCDRLVDHACAGRAADGLRPLLHTPVCRNGGSARVGVRLRPRHLAAALPRRRAPLLRPGCACRLGAPTEEAQCRRTSCCPT